MLGLDGETLLVPVGKGNGSLLRGRRSRQEAMSLYSDMVTLYSGAGGSRDWLCMVQACRR